MNVRPYVLPGSSTRTALAEQLDAATRNWCQDWIPGIALESGWRLYPLSGLTTETQRQIRGWDSVSGYADEASSVLFENRAGFAQRLLNLFASSIDPQQESEDSSLADRLVERAIDDLFRRVAQAVGVTAANSVAADLALENIDEEFRVGSGALYGELQLAGDTIHWLFTGCPAVMAKTGTGENRSALTNCANAIDNQTVNLKAWLGSVELSIDELGKMTVGDVLVLDRKLEEPIHLQVGNNPEPELHGRLCRQQQHKAIKLVS